MILFSRGCKCCFCNGNSRLLKGLQAHFYFQLVVCLFKVELKLCNEKIVITLRHCIFFLALIKLFGSNARGIVSCCVCFLHLTGDYLICGRPHLKKHCALKYLFFFLSILD
ncbi:hypothetical protein AB205_0194400 [Aquarana catesbeiana]|uniref:Uncharacterized protein n=1 Tax=Aquarana catesbeiana TaxID=8400 RepID=A0A2G9S2K1_AQUCT|nr:hypothetical protein AB205_0194400 [Aquarana catesbeiana]